MELFTTVWVVLSLAVVFAVMFTPLSIKLARKLGAMDSPNQRSTHLSETPRLGGVAIGLSMVFAIAFYIPFDRFVVGFLVGLLIIATTGLIDDVKSLTPRVKLLGEVIAATAFIYISGSELEGVGNLLGFGEISFGPFAFAVTVLCIVGLVNALNLSDGLDGLASGLALIAAVFFALLAYKTGKLDVLILSLALAGSLIGFLMYNSFPARLFMGDVGSLMIGYTCAVLAVHLSQGGGNIQVPPVNIALILAVPLLDTLLVMSRRIVRGDSPFEADRTHLHHRLLELGLNQNQAVSCMYVLMFFFGLVAIMGLSSEPYWLFLGAIVLMIVVDVMITRIRENPWRVVSRIWDVARIIKSIEDRQLEKLDRVWNLSRVAAANIVLLFFLAPLFFIDTQKLLLWWPVLLISVLLLLLFKSYNARVVALLHGLLYLIILLLLFLYRNGLDESWWHAYWSVLTATTMAWIIFGLLFAHGRRLMALHALEILLILLSWAVVVGVMPVLGYDQTQMADMRLVCVYAIPFLLLFKLCFSSGHAVAKDMGKSDAT